jgi:hypothetical protein
MPTSSASASDGRRLSLGALVHGSGGHIAGWRHPLARPDGQLDFAFHAELARILERGRFDAIFVADVVAIWGHQLDSLSRHRTRRALRAVDPALRALAGHRAHRPRRHRHDHVQPSVPHRPQVRLARPPLARPRRVEHRHLRRAAGGRELRPRGAPGARAALRARRGVRRCRARAVGQLRRRRQRTRQGRGPLLRPGPPAYAAPPRPELHRPRPAQHLRPPQGHPCSSKPAPPRPAGTSPRAMARCSSPPHTRWTRHARTTPTSRPRPPVAVAIRATCWSGPGSRR